MENGVRVKLQELERRVATIERYEPAQLTARFDALVESVREGRDEIAGMRKLLIGLLVSIVVATIGFSFTILQLVGR